jgi:hypothetical protein
MPINPIIRTGTRHSHHAYHPHVTVLLETVFALESIHTTTVILIIIVLPYLNVFLCGIGSFICYFYVGVFKYVGNFPDVTRCTL